MARDLWTLVDIASSLVISLRVSIAVRSLLTLSDWAGFFICLDETVNTISSSPKLMSPRIRCGKLRYRSVHIDNMLKNYCFSLGNGSLISSVSSLGAFLWIPGLYGS